MCRYGKERVQRCWSGRVLGKFKEHEEALCGWRGGKVGVKEKRAERVCVCVCVCRPMYSQFGKCLMSF